MNRQEIISIAVPKRPIFGNSVFLSNVADKGITLSGHMISFANVQNMGN